MVLCMSLALAGTSLLRSLAMSFALSMTLPAVLAVLAVLAPVLPVLPRLPPLRPPSWPMSLPMLLPAPSRLRSRALPSFGFWFSMIFP